MRLLVAVPVLAVLVAALFVETLIAVLSFLPPLCFLSPVLLPPAALAMIATAFAVVAVYAWGFPHHSSSVHAERTPLMKFLASLGWTRDDSKWVALQWISVAALISSGTIDLQYWAAYLGIPLGVTAQHWVIVLSALTLWVAGRSGNSGLPGKNDAASVSTSNFPRSAATILLACALGAGAVTATGCAGNKPPVTGPVLSDVKAAEIVKALDVARDTAKVVSDAYPSVVTAKDFQAILTFHSAAVAVIGATPNGWQPTVVAALDQVQKDLSPAASERLGPYLALVKTLVVAFVPGQL